MKKKVLFICTGNYYRSKFAEIYFNYMATKKNIVWEAFSRGFWVENPDNQGYISQFAIDELNKLQIPFTDERYPTPLTSNDLSTADIIIALNEIEHKHFVEKLFPGWKNRFVYWNVLDRQDASPILTLKTLRKKIDELLLRLD